MTRWPYLGARLEATLDRLHPLPPSAPVELEELLDRAGKALGVPLRPFLDEPALTELERSLTSGSPLAAGDGPELVHNAEPVLARACYVFCRGLRPAAVVETGVANGVSTTFVLRALAENGSGSLHSVDLAPPGSDPSLIGRLVPEELRGRWTLHRGASKDVLPALVRRLGPIGLFLHDSRHTYRNVRRELRTVSARLARPAAVVVDDAERHSALQDWAKAAGAAPVDLVEQPGKAALFGVAVLARDDLE